MRRSSSESSSPPTAAKVRAIASHPAYQDHAHKTEQWFSEPANVGVEMSKRIRATQTRDCFPVKLHALLEAISASSSSSPHVQVINWLSHGRAFKIFDRARFIQDLLPQYFSGQSKFQSFQRQLNIYGFTQLTGKHADSKGSYYHEYFLRGRPTLCRLLVRQESTSSVRQRLDLTTEPDFFQMPPLPPSLGVESSADMHDLPQELDGTSPLPLGIFGDVGLEQHSATSRASEPPSLGTNNVAMRAEFARAPKEPKIWQERTSTAPSPVTFAATVPSSGTSTATIQNMPYSATDDLSNGFIADHNQTHSLIRMTSSLPSTLQPERYTSRAAFPDALPPIGSAMMAGSLDRMMSSSVMEQGRMTSSGSMIPHRTSSSLKGLNGALPLAQHSSGQFGPTGTHNTLPAEYHQRLLGAPPQYLPQDAPILTELRLPSSSTQLPRRWELEQSAFATAPTIDVPELLRQHQRSPLACNGASSSIGETVPAASRAPPVTSEDGVADDASKATTADSLDLSHECGSLIGDSSGGDSKDGDDMAAGVSLLR